MLLKENKIKVGDNMINYVKVGIGPHYLFCLPGALGSIWTDFKTPMEILDRVKFTIIAWDPPGYGKSKPNVRNFSLDFHEEEAIYAYEFMKALKIPKFSLFGWCNGGITGMILAAKYPDAVNKLVIFGTKSFLTPDDVAFFNKMKDITLWSSRYRKQKIAAYGEAYFPKYFAQFVDGISNIYRDRNGNICTEFLEDIKCPTFFLHGKKDVVVDHSHASHLHKHIHGSIIYLYPDGKQNIHLSHSEDFKRRVEQFLTN